MVVIAQVHALEAQRRSHDVASEALVGEQGLCSQKRQRVVVAEPLGCAGVLDGRCTRPYARLVDLERKASYWTDIADYDMETARAMLATGRWLYAVFMSQQAMEKALKAAFLLLQRGNDPPRTHNLAFLLEQLERDDLPADVVSLANRLTAYYIESRYPSCKVMLSSLVDHAEAKSVVSRTEEALAWIRSLPA